MTPLEDLTGTDEQATLRAFGDVKLAEVFVRISNSSSYALYSI